MEREPKLKHDDGSVTFEGENEYREYLEHEHDHQKGRGEDDEHTGRYNHFDMHNIPHNSAPFSKYVDTAFPGARETISDAKTHRKFGKGSVARGSLSDLHEKPQPM